MPLSVDEAKLFKRVRSAIWFLRYCGKKPSRRLLASLLQVAEEPMRAAVILAFQERVFAVERLCSQDGNQAGTNRKPKNTYHGTRSKHDGNQIVQTTEPSGNQAGTGDRVLPITGKYNPKAVEPKHTGKRGDEEPWSNPAAAERFFSGMRTKFGWDD